MTSGVSVERAVLGSTYPRIATPPLVQGPAGPCGCGCALTPETSYGYDVEIFARDVLDRPLDPWQRHLVIHAGELLSDGRPRFRQVLVLVSRQNGKTWLLVILALYWLYVEKVRLILGTSTTLKYAQESWDKVVTLAQGTEVLARAISRNGVRRANGEQALSTVWGGRYLIAASNAEGGRSLTIDRLIADELRQQHSWDAYNAAVPAMNAVADAQAYFISNQGDDRSVVLNSLREQAIAGTDTRLGIFEWSSPDDMEPDDPEAIAMANPSLGRRIQIDAVMGEAVRAKAAGGDQLAQFLTEVHCRRVSNLNPAVDADAWTSCTEPGDLSGMRDRVVLCLDVSLDEEHASLYAAAVCPDGRVRVDAVEAWSGPQAVSEMRAALPDLVAQVKPQKLGWFPSGPAAAAFASIAQRPGWPPAGVSVEAIRAEVQAVCMGFAEQVRSNQIVHGEDDLLTEHVTGAERLESGDGWRFSRRGRAHSDAAYAAAGAVHLARLLQPRRKPSAFVFD